MTESKKKLLLLIEDNPLLTGMYKAAFERAGYEVVFAHDGISGLKLAEDKLPALILLDLLMPGIDGMTVLEKLKKNSVTNGIKVVVLTVLNKEESMKKAKELGAIDFLIKSELRLSEIVDKVISHLE